MGQGDGQGSQEGQGVPKRRPGRPRRAKAPSASLRLAAPRRPHPPGNVRIAVRPLFHTRLGCSAFAPRAERHFCPHKKKHPRLASIAQRSLSQRRDISAHSYSYAPRVRGARSEYGATSLLTRSLLADTSRLLSVGSGSGVGSGAQEPMNAYMHAFARRYAKTQTHIHL